jgi:predicted dehydrogenase
MTTSTQTPLIAAIIGAGRVGNYHTLAQIALGSKVIIYDPDRARANELAKISTRITVARELESAINAADVVHICTPPMHHVESALASIAAGKPTIVEKPLAFKLSDVLAIYRASVYRGTAPVILATSFRIGPSPMKIYDYLRADKIGTLSSLETTYVHDVKNLESGPTWRKQLEGPAFLYEGGTHAVDLNMWLADQPVITVQASVGKKKIRHEYKWDEDFAVNLKYADGLLGRVWINAAAPFPKHGSGLAVCGSAGAYRAHSKDSHFESYEEGDTAWRVHPVDGTLTMLTMQLMAAVFNDYIRGARADFRPMPDIEDGLKLMIVLNTIEKALQSGKTEEVPALEEVVSAN